MRNMSSLKLNKKETYEDYFGPFHMLVPNRQLTPNSQVSRTLTNGQKFYRMPVVKKRAPESLKYMESDTTELSISNLSDPTEIYWHKVEIVSWKPETRQASTFTMSNGKIYLIGGISKSIHHQIFIYYPMTKKWERLDVKGSQPRFGHTALEYEKSLIVFGGSTEYNQAYKLRECISGIYQFYTNTLTWEPLENKGVHIQPRKFHAACIIGKQLFVHGGMNNKNKILDEVAVYDFYRKGWTNGDFSGNSPGYRAFHTVCTILNPDQFPLSLFSLNSTKYLNVKIPGLYLFGGVKQDGKPCNELHVLDLSQSPPVWIMPITSGCKPLPRSSHTMIFINKLSLLLIHGGKSNPNSCEEVFLSDVVLLRVDTLNWNNVKVYGETPCARSGHSIEAIGTRVFIFGGITSQGYCSSDLYIIELNPRNVKSYIQD